MHLMGRGRTGGHARSKSEVQGWTPQLVPRATSDSDLLRHRPSLSEVAPFTEQSPNLSGCEGEGGEPEGRQQGRAGGVEGQEKAPGAAVAAKRRRRFSLSGGRPKKGPGAAPAGSSPPSEAAAPPPAQQPQPPAPQRPVTPSSWFGFASRSGSTPAKGLPPLDSLAGAGPGAQAQGQAGEGPQGARQGRGPAVPPQSRSVPTSPAPEAKPLFKESAGSGASQESAVSGAHAAPEKQRRRGHIRTPSLSQLFSAKRAVTPVADAEPAASRDGATDAAGNAAGAAAATAAPGPASEDPLGEPRRDAKGQTTPRPAGTTPTPGRSPEGPKAGPLGKMLGCMGSASVKQEEEGEEVQAAPGDPSFSKADGKEAEAKLPLGAAGFQNIGNTCFISVGLQCLRHTPGFQELLLPELVTGEPLPPSRFAPRPPPRARALLPATPPNEQAAGQQAGPAGQQGQHPLPSTVRTSRFADPDSTWDDAPGSLLDASDLQACRWAPAGAAHSAAHGPEHAQQAPAAAAPAAAPAEPALSESGPLPETVAEESCPASDAHPEPHAEQPGTSLAAPPAADAAPEVSPEGSPEGAGAAASPQLPEPLSKLSSARTKASPFSTADAALLHATASCRAAAVLPTPGGLDRVFSQPRALLAVAGPDGGLRGGFGGPAAAARPPAAGPGVLVSLVSAKSTPSLAGSAQAGDGMPAAAAAAAAAAASSPSQEEGAQVPSVVSHPIPPSPERRLGSGPGAGTGPEGDEEAAGAPGVEPFEEEAAALADSTTAVVLVESEEGSGGGEGGVSSQAEGVTAGEPHASSVGVSDTVQPAGPAGEELEAGEAGASGGASAPLERAGGGADAEGATGGEPQEALAAPAEGEHQQQQQQEQQQEPESRPLEKGEIASAFRQLLYHAARLEGGAAADPSQLLQCLAASPLADYLCDGGQHDCHEALRALFQALHEDLTVPAAPAPAAKEAAAPAEGSLPPQHGAPPGAPATAAEPAEPGSAAAEPKASAKPPAAPTALTPTPVPATTTAAAAPAAAPASAPALPPHTSAAPAAEAPAAGPSKPPRGFAAAKRSRSGLLGSRPTTPEALGDGAGGASGEDEREKGGPQGAASGGGVGAEGARQRTAAKEAAAREEEAAKADAHWRAFLRADASLVTSTFGGQLQSSVVCSKCKGRFTTYEPFYDLSLPLAKERGGLLASLSFSAPTLTLESCLTAFTADESMSGEEAFACARCGERTPATKHLRLHRLPRVLVLHLKRFRHAGAAQAGDKLSTPVAFPLTGLKLNQFASEESGLHQPRGGGRGASSGGPHKPGAPPSCEYELFAVCNHVGNLGNGHYTATCRVSFPPEAAPASKPPGDAAPGTAPSAGPSSKAQGPGSGGQKGPAPSCWLNFNDEVVTEIPAGEVVSPNAYILCYVCKEPEKGSCAP